MTDLSAGFPAAGAMTDLAAGPLSCWAMIGR